MTDLETRLVEENARLKAELAAANAARELLRSENEVLLRRIEQLTAELANAKDADAQQALKLELKVLNERLARKEREMFGTRSERRPRTEDATTSKTKPPKKRSKTGRTAQPKLEKKVQEHLFDEADLTCPKCGHRMVIKSKTAGYTQIHVEVRRYKIVEQRAQVAGCGGCGAEESAEYPKPWVKGARYSEDFAIDVAFRKYGLHLPLARQEREMKRLGLDVRRNTLAGLLGLLHDFVAPSVELMHTTLLTEPVLHADETTWRMMPGKGGSSKWWVWTLASSEAAVFLIQPTRSKNAAARLLRDYDGTLVCDGYGAYAALERLADKKGDLGLEGVPVPNFDLAGCWSHARRGFVHAQDQADVAHVFLDDIDLLFQIEDEAREEVANDPSQSLVTARERLRAEKSRPVVERIYERCASTVRFPKSAVDKAIGYLVNQRTALERFLSDGRVPLTNNHAERIVRGPVQGRKAHQGSRSEGGTRIAGVFYSAIQSCQLVGVDPVAYMTVLVRRGMKEPGYALLPREFAAELAREGQPPEG
ncbi:MAG: IS66 family transposase [Gaiellaceae bacterium]